MHQLESFLLGIFAAISSLIVEILIFIIYSYFSNNTDQLALGLFFTTPVLIILSAFIEELFKYIVIAKKIASFSSKNSIILNSIISGFGFFSIELIIIFYSNNIPTIYPFFEIAILHMGTAGLIGYFLENSSFKNSFNFLKTTFFVTFFHSMYNIFSTKISLNNFYHFLIIFILIIITLINIFNIYKVKRELADN